MQIFPNLHSRPGLKHDTRYKSQYNTEEKEIKQSQIYVFFVLTSLKLVQCINEILHHL